MLAVRFAPGILNPDDAPRHMCRATCLLILVIDVEETESHVQERLVVFCFFLVFFYLLCLEPQMDYLHVLSGGLATGCSN